MTSAAQVPIARVLGFRYVAGKDQIHLTRFMAHVEGVTGLTGDAALVEFAKRTIE